jgi:hypothetical protein
MADLGKFLSLLNGRGYERGREAAPAAGNAFSFVKFGFDRILFVVAIREVFILCSLDKDYILFLRPPFLFLRRIIFDVICDVSKTGAIDRSEYG